MKKKIAILIVVSLLTGIFAGCGNGGGAAATTAAVTTQTAATTQAAVSPQGAETTKAAETTQGAESSSAAEKEKKPVITSKEMPLYYDTPETDKKVTVSFVDGQTDIPYIDLQSMAELIQWIENENGDPKYTLTVSGSSGVQTLTRDNGSKVEVDCDKQQVSYDNFNEFFRNTYAKSSLDVLSNSGFDSDNQPAYFSREGVTSFERKGSPIDVELYNHDIPIYYQDGKAYIPLQTASDLFCAQLLIALAYNGNGVFMCSGDLSGDLKDLYYSAPKGKRSKSLAEFTYNELALALDMYYGLKDAHNIDTFENFFATSGLDEKLLSEDPEVADQAVEDLCYDYFGDGHSGFNKTSFYAGEDANAKLLPTLESISSGYRDVIQALLMYGKCRSEAYPDGVPGYEEIGNTAYITFDHFTFPKDVDYYETKATPGSADTVGLIQYAHSRIMRKGSPIKNVVMDLSVNGGGEADAAVYTVSWFLGISTFNIEDTVSRMQATTQYRCDVNGDRVFDDNDTVQSKKLFCITSPYSFSCGNLVPSAFKKSGRVTLLGRTSGGGACVVQPLSMADGTLLNVSGNKRISTNVNGSFYDVDTGAVPDIVITSPEKFYDRKALTKYINSLY